LRTWSNLEAGNERIRIHRVQAILCFRLLIAGFVSADFNRTNIMKTKITIVSQLCVLTLTVAALSVAGVAMAQDASAAKSSSLSVKDKTFMKKAAKGGMMEVAMGNLAEQNGQSEDVKSFGKRMVTDHSKANDELKSIASKKGVQLPSKEPAAKWSSDKAYMDAMVKDHEKDLAEFQEEAKTGSDPDVKKFAEDTAKMVQEHLDLAKETQSKLK
jgi:putative membrane protein